MENGGYFVSPICKKYSENRTEEQHRINKVIDSIKTLTVTEQKILLMISQGKTTAHIADMLNNSYKTIENHRTNISQKLNLAGSSSLLRFAMENESLIKQILAEE
jgi:two-component system nitrate/nitrite response regulator NarL